MNLKRWLSRDTLSMSSRVKFPADPELEDAIREAQADEFYLENRLPPIERNPDITLTFRPRLIVDEDSWPQLLELPGDEQ